MDRTGRAGSARYRRAGAFQPSPSGAGGRRPPPTWGWVQQAGIQEILLGGLATPERRIHGPDEHTTIDDIAALARSVLLYLAADFDPDTIPELTP